MSYGKLVLEFSTGRGLFSTCCKSGEKIVSGKSKLPCQVCNFYCYFFIGRQLLTSRTTVFFLLVCVLRDGIAKRFQRSLSQVPPHRWDVRV